VSSVAGDASDFTLVRKLLERRRFDCAFNAGASLLLLPLNLDANRTTSFSLAWTLLSLLRMHVCNALFSMIGKLTQNIGSMALKYVPQIFGPEPFV